MMTDAEALAIAASIAPNAGGFFKAMLAKAVKRGAEHEREMIRSHFALARDEESNLTRAQFFHAARMMIKALP